MNLAHARQIRAQIEPTLAKEAPAKPIGIGGALMQDIDPQELKTKLSSSAGWSQLDSAHQRTLLERIDSNEPLAFMARSRLSSLMKNPSWSSAGGARQSEALRRLATQPPPAAMGMMGAAAKPPEAPGKQEAQNKLEATEGFDELTEQEQQRFETLLSAERNPLSREARRQVDNLVYGLEPDSPELQETLLRDFLKEGPHVPGNTSRIDVQQAPIHAVSIKGRREVPDYEFRGVQADAILHSVEIGGRSVDIFMPKDQSQLPEDAPHLPTVDDVAAGLSRLSPQSLASFERVVINPARNPDDDYWAEEMERPGFRAAATASRDGTMTFYPTKTAMDAEELGDIARHEAGHFNSFDKVYPKQASFLESLLGKSPTGPDWEDWTNAAVADGNYVSHYGGENKDEDYAESYGLYMGTKGTPLHDEYRQIFPNRFALLDGLTR